MSETSVRKFLQQQAFAVVGASDDSSKYGYKVYKDLKGKGYQVKAVNPNHKIVDGDPCYPSLKDLAGKVDGAIMVVPPAVTEKSVGDALTAGIKNIWMQPGAESQAAVDYCKDKGLNCIAQKCVMVESEK